MRAPLSWLCDYAPFDQPVEVLADALSDLGLVVEGIERVGAAIPGVVVARVLAIRPHPNADRIRLVDVDTGAGESLQIACGAWNFAVGDLVPAALVGAELPNGMTIARRKMRGEVSNGMLCSPTEIGLPPEEGVDGLMILPPGSAEPGTPIADALGGADTVFDLEVSPNRPDALSMAGVARDLAAALGVAWTWPTGLPAGAAAPAAATTDPAVGGPQITVEDTGLCPAFTAALVRDVTVAPSPSWLARRLVLAGMRPINNVVDVSNYVMLDVGQPNHAYDLDRLGGGGLRVRRAAEGEQVVTLDGQTRRVGPDDLLIADGDSVPVGIAGVMGAEVAEVGAATTSLLLEAAWFDPATVARTGTRLGLTSEARHRFERGVDPTLGGRAVARFAQLLAAVTPDGAAAPRLGPPLEIIASADLPVPAEVLLRLARVNAVLGTDLDGPTVAGLLAPIGFTAVPDGPGRWSVTVPPWRPDTTREIDVIEEVARHFGYRNIARRMPAGARVGGLTPYQRDRRFVRDVLAGAGLDECWTTTFLAPGDLTRAGLAPDAVVVANPLDQAESVLRPSLLPGLLAAARFNRDRQAAAAALFETGRVFAPPSGAGPTPDEREDLAWLLWGPATDATDAVRVWTVLAAALGVEGVRLVAGEFAGLHPTRTARLVAGGTVIGAVGEVDPDVVAAAGLAGRVAWGELSLEALLAQPRRDRTARPVSRYPASDVDLAFVVDETVVAADVADTLSASGAGLLEDLALWDVYRGAALGAGRRGLTFRLRFRAADRTLAEAELAAARQAAIDAVVGAHEATLRS